MVLTITLTRMQKNSEQFQPLRGGGSLQQATACRGKNDTKVIIGYYTYHPATQVLVSQ